MYPLREKALQLDTLLTVNRIVEYATRDQAQTAVNTLSNQNLMGRLVYVREVGGFAPYIDLVGSC